MDHVEALNTLEALIAQAKGVPLSASVVVPRDEALELLRTLRETLPRETEEAKEVVAERDRVLADARQEAQQLLDQARSQRARMLAETEVVQAAEREARRIVGDAETTANQLRTRADDYVDAKLANFEILLNKVLRTVNRGRDQLRRRLEAAQDEVPPLQLEDSGEISGPIPGTGERPGTPQAPPEEGHEGGFYDHQTE